MKRLKPHTIDWPQIDRFLAGADKKLASARKILAFDEEACLQLVTVLDRLRRKRNLALYDDTGFVSHHDAEQALEAARDYLAVIRADVASRKP
jgi:hypothetical protein